MIDLHHERNFVRILASSHAEHAESGRYRITAAFKGKLYDIFRVKIIWVLREARTCRMFNALIHRQDAQIASASQPPRTIQSLKIYQNSIVAI
jgi:hypothetical protein